MAFSSGSGGGPQSEINVTPLVDVVLVLLIIFMVITPLLQTGMKADIPKIPEEPPPNVEPDPDQLIVSIKDNGDIYLNQDKVTDDELKARLSAQMKGRSKDKQIAFLAGSENLFFGHVVHVMDMCKGAGVDRVGIIDPI